ncbi:adenosylmethionine--8-amino-7-oxononanoate transaminase [Hahella sp. SMD15-11]|uniref:Adenosylmethionine-8-amino-7-oxononanoate aminotransferase n=1 Tax=Thermohahella caldifontis TaxID=3142973 RepID=A0AB39USW0_9GAMM
MATTSELDAAYLWHPYSSIHPALPPYPVVSAEGVRFYLESGEALIDGMSSWWCAIHGYNHPALNDALHAQIDRMAHIMFGGLTHRPAAKLAELLVQETPDGLNRVFFSDSGSVSVEVALKMAIQYWQVKGRPGKTKMLAVRGGYHGDTFHAMSVCDPVTGMHHLFSGVLPKQYFLDRPRARFGEPADPLDLEAAEALLKAHADQIAAFIVEPVVQGAGGMYFYSAAWLEQIVALCRRHDVLVIFDEIATGFGRTGRLFAADWVGVTPDIMCVGKALTGGYMTLAATLTTDAVAETLSSGEPGVFMHGPTFMANPLACSVAIASLNLLLASPWKEQVLAIEAFFRESLEEARNWEGVADVRALGAIGVIELTAPVDLARLTPLFVERGVWVRPFGKLVYLMPPYIIDRGDLAALVDATKDAVRVWLAMQHAAGQASQSHTEPNDAPE